MVNSYYTPTYYSTLQDSITSMCKNILPFSFKKKRLPAIAAAEQKLSKHQSDNLKWQQESYHQILNLMGLCKEGILQENEVSAFRSHLLDTLIASPLDYEHVVILKDKLVFLQELFYAQIITEEEYHSSKRPLLQRLAVQGAEIEARDLVVGEPKAKTDEEWAAIDLKDDKCLIVKENVNSKAKTKHGSTIKEAATSVFSFGSSAKTGKLKEEKGVCGLGKQQEFGPFSSGKNEVGVSQENPFWNCSVRDGENETKSILMAPETLPQQTCDKKSGGEKMKKNNKQWGFEGFKRWKKSDTESETAPLSLVEKSDGETYLGKLVEIPLGGGPDTVQMKKKLNSDGSSSGFFVDKVLGDKIRKELTRIQMEIKTKNPNAQFTKEQIEVISTRLPVDKVDLKKFFPKTWCDRYGELVLDVVRNEFKEHVGEMKGQQQQKQQTFAKDNNKNTISTNKWATFDDEDENCHPNLFAPPPPPPRQSYSVAMKQSNFVSANADMFAYGSSSRHY